MRRGNKRVKQTENQMTIRVAKKNGSPANSTNLADLFKNPALEAEPEKLGNSDSVAELKKEKSEEEKRILKEKRAEMQKKRLIKQKMSSIFDNMNDMKHYSKIEISESVLKKEKESTEQHNESHQKQQAVDNLKEISGIVSETIVDFSVDVSAQVAPELAFEHALLCILDPIHLNWDHREKALHVLMTRYDKKSDHTSRAMERIRKEGVFLNQAMELRKQYTQSNKLYDQSSFAVRNNFSRFIFGFFINFSCCRVICAWKLGGNTKWRK